MWMLLPLLICSCFLWQIMTFSDNIRVLPSKLQRCWQGIKKAFALTSLISSIKRECWSDMMETSSSSPLQTTQHRLPPCFIFKTNISAKYFPAPPASPRSVCQRLKVELTIAPREGNLRNTWQFKFFSFNMAWSTQGRRLVCLFFCTVLNIRGQKRLAHFTGSTLERMLPGSSARASLWMCNCSRNSASTHNHHGIKCKE